jgi:hypothetical protein
MFEVCSWCLLFLFRPPLKFVDVFIHPISCRFIIAVRSPSMSTGEHPSTKEVLQATTRKHGVEHTKGSTETVHMKPGSTGEAGVGGGRRAEQPSFGRGGNINNSPASAEKVVVVARYGPRPHPKKHN